MITIVINGQNYDYPQVGDTEWGDAATTAMQALATTTLQPVKDLNDPTTVNNFTLYNDINFGNTNGLRVLFVESNSNNPALNGVFRLCNGELVAWKNGNNDGDNSISFDNSDNFVINGNTISFDVDGEMLVNGVQVTRSGEIVNADVADSAGIVESKLALDYSTQSLYDNIENHKADTNNPHSVTKSQVLTGDLIVNADVDNSASIEESKLALDYGTSTLNTNIEDHKANTNNPHVVTKSQVLTGDLIVNADVDNAASIVESKLSLDYGTSTLNTNIENHKADTSNPHSTSVANLTDTTISSVASGQVLTYDGSKWVNQASASASLTGLSDTDINTPSNGDTLVYDSVTTKWKNSNTLSSHISNTSNPHSVTKSQVLTGDLIVNADVDNSAAIAESKLNLDYSTSSLNTSIGNVAGDLSSHEGNTSNPHSTSIDNLTDSDIESNTLTSNDVIVFNDQTLKWENSQILVNHIGNTANPHLTTVGGLTDTNLSSLADKQLLQYDQANLQWVNSSEVWSRIEVNDIANINTATTDITLTASDKRHQIFTATNGFTTTLPSTGINAGESFIFGYSNSWWSSFTNSFVFNASDNTRIFVDFVEFWDTKITALVDNPTTSTDWAVERILTRPFTISGKKVSIAFTFNGSGIAEPTSGLIGYLPRCTMEFSYHIDLGMNTPSYGYQQIIFRRAATSDSTYNYVYIDNEIVGSRYGYNLPLSSTSASAGVVSKSGALTLDATGVLQFPVYCYMHFQGAANTSDTVNVRYTASVVSPL